MKPKASEVLVSCFCAGEFATGCKLDVHCNHHKVPENVHLGVKPLKALQPMSSA